jgi:hypothetical protein
MGNEAKCVARIDGKRVEGRALLETSELIFRGAECRMKITFGEVRSVTASDGELRIKTKDRAFVFLVGAAAEKWREKILHPKTRVEKLGVQAGMRVALLGDMETGFTRELRTNQAGISGEGAEGEAELVFLAVQKGSALGEVAKIAKRMKGAAALWIVYPKGKKEITESDVLGAGRKAGLKDVKVVGFSATHTALKFVIAVEKR